MIIKILWVVTGFMIPLMAIASVPTFPIMLDVPPKFSPNHPAEQYLDATIVLVSDNDLGSGFFISEDGYFVTNYHVARSFIKHGTGFIFRTRDGEEHQGTIEALDIFNDIALGKVTSSPDKKFPYLKPSPEIAKCYQRVHALGNGSWNLFKIKDIQYLCYDSKKKWELRLTDGVLPGDSGGPVIDSRGEVIGMVSAKDLVNNTTMAVPVQDIKSFVSTQGVTWK